MLHFIHKHSGGRRKREILSRLRDGADDTLYITGSAEHAFEAARELECSREGMPAQNILSQQDFWKKLLSVFDGIVVDEAAARVILRELLGQSPDLLSGLTGKPDTVGVSVGLLQDLVRQIHTVRRNGSATQPLPPAHQLIADRFKAHLKTHNLTLESEARDAITGNRFPEYFQRAFPSVKTVLSEESESSTGRKRKLYHGFRKSHIACTVLLPEEPAPDHEEEPQGDLFGDLIETTRPAPGIVDLITCYDAAAEVKLIAAAVRSEIDVACDAGKQIRYGDFLVCLPRSYSELVHDIFTDYRLPYFIRNEISVREHSLWQYVSAVKAVVASGFDLGSVRDMVKSPYCVEARGRNPQVDTSLIDRLRPDLGLENEKLGRALSLLEEYARAAEEGAALDEDERELSRSPAHIARDCRALLQFLTEIRTQFDAYTGTRSAGDWLSAIQTLLDERLQKTAVPRQLRAAPAVAAGIMESAVAVSRLAVPLNLRNVSFAGFLSLVRLHLFHQSIPGDDSDPCGILVCPVEAAVGIGKPFIFVGGLADGTYPQAPNSLFAESTGQTDYWSARQHRCFEELIASGGSRVVLTAPQHAENEELMLSVFVEEMEKAGSIRRRNAAELRSDRALSGVEQQSAIALAVRHAETSKVDCESKPHLSDNVLRLLQQCAFSITANAERRSMEGVGLFDGFVEDKALLELLRRRADRRIYSVAQLDVLVQCRFRYFAERVLALQPEPQEVDDLSPQVLGLVVHSILFRFYRRWMGEHKRLIGRNDLAAAENLLREEAVRELKRIRLQFVRELIERKLFGHTSPQALQTEGAVSRYRGILRAFLDYEICRAETNPGIARPALFEYAFGTPPRFSGTDDETSAWPEPVELEMLGEKVRVRGRADRIDIGDSAFTVIDYKTGYSPTITAQKGGFHIQLPLYLMIFDHIFRNSGRELEPAGGFFYSVTPTEAGCKGQFYREQFRSMETFGTRQRLMTEEDYQEAMLRVRARIAAGLSEARDGHFYVTMADEKLACGRCEWENFCRKDLARARRMVPLVTPNWGLEEDLIGN